MGKSSENRIRKSAAHIKSGCLGLALVLVVSCAAQAQALSGYISVRSGVSFRMMDSSLEYRLFGIGGCEVSQVAHLNGVAWPCGAVATGWLTQLTLGYQIDCLDEGRAEDQYATVLVRCFLPSGEDIARLALREGMAWVMYQDGQPIVPEYVAVEEEARSERRGIWSSNFMLGTQLYRP